MAPFILGVLALATAAPAPEKTPAPIDWGGGFVRAGDSKTTTVATAGADVRAAPPAPKPGAPPPPKQTLTDWGGGYFKAGDSAAVTPATSGGR